MTDIEYELSHWVKGSIQAERMCANLLFIDGFRSINPQAPLGGPDGLKDIICEKNQWKYIAAVYFPDNEREKDYSAIEAKFKHDFDGVEKNDVNGIIFMTNCRMTLEEKTKLEKVTYNDEKTAIIYDRERLLQLLTTPSGYGIRLVNLGIQMSLDEQISYFDTQANMVPTYLKEASNYIIEELSQRIDNSIKNSEDFKANIEELTRIAHRTASMISSNMVNRRTNQVPFPSNGFRMRDLGIEDICYIGKMLTYNTNQTEIGKLRSVEVWITGIGKTIEEAEYIPPKPDEIEEELKKILEKWNQNYESLNQEEDRRRIIEAIVDFHSKFLEIHPFIDGNGRIARFILNQQASELLGIKRVIIIENRESYINALKSYQKGDKVHLRKLITQAIFGQEELY